MQDNDNKILKSRQERFNVIDESYQFLSDCKNGKENDWKGKKIKSSRLSQSYARLGMSKKATLVKFCGSDLVFKVPVNLNGEKKLHTANFCKVRLCPMCAWRRSLKTFAIVNTIMNLVCSEKNYEFLFLTLTIKNVKGEELLEALDNIFYGFKKLVLKKQWKQ